MRNTTFPPPIHKSFTSQRKFGRPATHFLWILIAAAFMVSCQPSDSPPAKLADIILKNGIIYTMIEKGHAVEAIAIVGSKIAFIGTNQEIDSWLGPQTKIIDLEGKMALPGFTDGHIHPIVGGTRLMNCDLTDLRSEEEILEKVREYVTAHPDKEWIVGGGLWLPAIGNGNPNKSILDEIDSKRPIYLSSADGHNAWVNSKALEIAGISKETASPIGGVIERDPQGRPSGTLREYAMGLVARHLPPTTPEDRVVALKKAISLAHQNGIIAWVDASVKESSIQTYLAVEREDSLKMEVTLSLTTEIIKELEAVEEVISLYSQYQSASDHINFKSTKIFIDGVIEGKTAALFENYIGESFRGQPYINSGIYNQIISAYDSAGFQVHVHACGDYGVSMTLDAFEVAKSQQDLRHHIVHLQLMDEKDIPRFKSLDVIANLQTLWATPEDTYISELTIPVLGPERTEWIYPFGAIAKTGAKLANGSDWPVTTINPFHAIQVAVTRRGPDKKKRTPWTPQHLMNLHQVLEGYTKGGAYLMFQESQRGTIEVGKDASLMVLDQNLYQIPKEMIHQTKVLLTFWNGEAVYQSDFFKPMD